MDGPSAGLVSDRSQTHSLPYRPDIDGLRAVAVLPVVLHHAGFAAFRGGFVGVDVFFVISGFLITRIIDGKLPTNSFSLLDFYERRIRRIFPALFAVVGGTFALTLVLYLSDDLVLFARSAESTAVFSSNIFFFAKSNYFAAASQFKPLLHTWSLAVEEQFYLFYPLMLIAAHRFAPRRLVGFLVVAAGGSLAACVLVLPRSPNAVFYLAPFRAWELFLGGIVAVAPVVRTQRALSRDLLGAAGLGLIGYAVFFFNPEMDFPGPAALVPCGGAAILLYIGQGGTARTSALLGSSVPRFFGLISYSLYLWHWPIIVIYGYAAFPARAEDAAPALVAASIVVAVASWRWIERPFRGRALVRTQPTAFKIAVGATAAAILAGAAIDWSDGFPQRFPQLETRIAALSAGYEANRTECTAQAVSRRPIPAECVFGNRSAPPTYAVWGDSHGTELVVGLGRLVAAKGASIVQITHTQCPAALRFATRRKHGCPKSNDLALRFLLADKAIGRVVLAAHYHYYDDRRHIGPFQAGFADAVAKLLAAGKTVYIVYPIPESGASVPQAAALYLQHGKDPQSLVISLASYWALNRRMITFLDSLRGDNIVRIYPTDALCDDKSCTTMSGGHVLYFDTDHLNSYGVQFISRLFQPLIAEGQVR